MGRKASQKANSRIDSLLNPNLLQKLAACNPDSAVSTAKEDAPAASHSAVAPKAMPTPTPTPTAPPKKVAGLSAKLKPSAPQKKRSAAAPVNFEESDSDDDDEDLDLGFLDKPSKSKSKSKSKTKSSRSAKKMREADRLMMEQQQDPRDQSTTIYLPNQNQTKTHPQHQQSQHSQQNPYAPPAPPPPIQVVVPPSPLKEEIDLLAAYTSIHGAAFLSLALSRPDPPWYAKGPIRRDAPEEEVYFWWRTYSYAMGDTDLRWRSAPFPLLLNSDVTLAPPPPADPTHTMTAALKAEWEVAEKKLTKPSVARVRKGLRFCMSRSPQAGAVSKLLSSSLQDPSRSGQRLICLLYVASDVLYNSQQRGVKNVHQYRTNLMKALPDILKQLGERARSSNAISGTALQSAASRCLAAWESWGLWDATFQESLYTALHGRPPTPEEDEEEEEDIDGEPLTEDEEDIDRDVLSGEGG